MFFYTLSKGQKVDSKEGTAVFFHYDDVKPGVLSKNRRHLDINVGLSNSHSFESLRRPLAIIRECEVCTAEVLSVL